MYSPQLKNIWQGREDTDEGEYGLRWHQKIRIIDLHAETLPELKDDEKGIVVLGLKSDEGVRRNKGRIGAIQGPEALRNACCNFADHFQKSTTIYDGGNIICENRNLEDAQNDLRKEVEKALSKGYLSFVFGGGHEVAYPHYMALIDHFPAQETIGIINVDAHFDLRKPENQATSGTPFFQISEECRRSDRPFNYFCVGIQKSANTKALFKRAEALGVSYILSNEINLTYFNKTINQINKFIDSVDHIYLTICLDAFDIAFAPGVSAPTSFGLNPIPTIEIIKNIVASGKLVASDIAELNPKFDHDSKTARLAAKIAYDIITDYQSRKK